MAPRQREPQPAPTSNVFSNVLSFVSRELESFVNTATGGGGTEARPEASTSRVKLDDARGKSDRRNRSRIGGDGVRRKRPRENVEEVEERTVEARRGKQSRRESDSDSASPTPPARRRRRKKTPMRKSPTPTPAPEDVSDSDRGPISNSRSRSRSPAPLPIPALKIRSTPVTMPGSFFPRSESLQPDATPSPTEVARHVRFLPRTPSPVPKSSHEENSKQPDTTANAKGSRRESSGDTVDEFRGRTSGRDAGRSRGSVDATKRGRSRTRDVSSVRMGVADDTNTTSRTLEPSGKTRVADRDEDEEESTAETRIQKSEKARGKERAWDTSGEVQVRGKERELRAVREAHLRNEPARDDEERERDKQRIRMLEEEIARLRAQLAARGNLFSEHPPPPPPPPPPPLRFTPTHMPSQTTGRPLGPERANSFLASIRANLKHTGLPVEAPINDVGGRTRRAGQPTVNVPSDKMAAFLTEVKTAKLRKVGSGAMLPPPSTARSYAFGERSFSAIEGNIGEKRKRGANMAEDFSASAPSKRRFSTFAVPSVPTGSSQSSSSSQTSYDSQQNASGSSSSLMFPPPAHLPSRNWPSIATTETDITTPSLCSDNENERDVDEWLPHTPPQPTRQESPKVTQQRRPEVEREVIDVDMEPPQPQRTPEPRPHPPAQPKEKTTPHIDLFARRLPRSPMPANIPKRIPAPARKRAKPMRIENDDGSNGDDPLSLTYSPPVSERVSRPKASALPVPVKHSSKVALKARARSASKASRDANISSTQSGVQSQSQSQQASQPTASSQSRRRKTLDEELRRAGDSLWTEDGALDADDSAGEHLESGEFMGVGTVSKKRGFLKGGGAAGAPVFMGVGYVQGAEEDGDDEDDDPPVPPRRVRTSKPKERR